jgi:hypothetical protein
MELYYKGRLLHTKSGLGVDINFGTSSEPYLAVLPYIFNPAEDAKVLLVDKLLEIIKPLEALVIGAGYNFDPADVRVIQAFEELEELINGAAITAPLLRLADVVLMKSGMSCGEVASLIKDSNPPPRMTKALFREYGHYPIVASALLDHDQTILTVAHMSESFLIEVLSDEGLRSEIRELVFERIFSQVHLSLKLLDVDPTPLNESEKNRLYEVLVKDGYAATALLRKSDLTGTQRRAALLAVCSKYHLADNFLRANFHRLSEDEVSAIGERISAKPVIKGTTFKLLDWPKRTLPGLIKSYGEHFTAKHLEGLSESDAIRIIQIQTHHKAPGYLQDLSFWNEAMIKFAITFVSTKHVRVQPLLIESLLNSVHSSKVEKLVSAMPDKGLFSFFDPAFKTNELEKMRVIEELVSRQDFTALALVLRKFHDCLSHRERTVVLAGLAQAMLGYGFLTSLTETALLTSIPLSPSDKSYLVQLLLNAGPRVLILELMQFFFETKENLLSAVFAIIIDEKHKNMKKDFLLKCIRLSKINKWKDPSFDEVLLSQCTYKDLVASDAGRSLRRRKIESGNIRNWQTLSAIPSEDVFLLLKEVSKTSEERLHLYEVIRNKGLTLKPKILKLATKHFSRDLLKTKSSSAQFIRGLDAEFLAEALKYGSSKSKSFLEKTILAHVQNLKDAFAHLPPQLSNQILSERPLKFKLISSKEVEVSVDDFCIGRAIIGIGLQSNYPISEIQKSRILQLAAPYLVPEVLYGFLNTESGELNIEGMKDSTVSARYIDGRISELLSAEDKRAMTVPVILKRVKYTYYASLNEAALSGQSKLYLQTSRKSSIDAPQFAKAKKINIEVGFKGTFTALSAESIPEIEKELQSIVAASSFPNSFVIFTFSGIFNRKVKLELARKIQRYGTMVLAGAGLRVPVTQASYRSERTGLIKSPRAVLKIGHAISTEDLGCVPTIFLAYLLIIEDVLSGESIPNEKLAQSLCGLILECIALRERARGQAEVEVQKAVNTVFQKIRVLDALAMQSF